MEVTDMSTHLDATELRRLDLAFRAANYLSVGQIYLRCNGLLREPLQTGHVKHRLLGHWGTTPGLNFLYVHLNRIIRLRQRDVLFVAGPGHGGPALVANTWLEGSWSEHYPNLSRTAEDIDELFRQFSFPGGIGSHVTPEVPGSIHEGGESAMARPKPVRSRPPGTRTSS
jgi:xylulose-5-phosphate/fructose-6-phosphate phosphoketolase